MSLEITIDVWETLENRNLNLADFPSKHQIVIHHNITRCIYLYEEGRNSAMGVLESYMENSDYFQDLIIPKTGGSFLEGTGTPKKELYWIYCIS